MKPLQGRIWWVDFGEPVGREQAGRRPAVVVSANPLNQGPAGVVVVVPLTTTHRGLPSHVEIEAGAEAGLDETSYGKCDDLESISDRRLVGRLGVAPPCRRSRPTVLLAEL